jgi:hypothetical protein
MAGASETTDFDKDSFLFSYWPLTRQLSNPTLEDDGIFTVEEKVADGLIVYKLSLNSFLAIDESKKKMTAGTGFYQSKHTRNVRLDDGNPYLVRFEACGDTDDWSADTCDLRPYLHMKSGILFGGEDDAASAAAVLVKKAKNVPVSKNHAYNSNSDSDSIWDMYEMSAEEARAYVMNQEEEGQLELDEGEENIETYESHPEHKPRAAELILHDDDSPLFSASTKGGGPQFVANGLFGDGGKLGKLISIIMDGSPHPGKIKWRSDAKGHRYLGCEKHEHPNPGDLRVSKAICT